MTKDVSSEQFSKIIFGSQSSPLSRAEAFWWINNGALGRRRGLWRIYNKNRGT